jgi:hypothetical protein
LKKIVSTPEKRFDVSFELLKCDSNYESGFFVKTSFELILDKKIVLTDKRFDVSFSLQKCDLNYESGFFVKTSFELIK